MKPSEASPKNMSPRKIFKKAWSDPDSWSLLLGCVQWACNLAFLLFPVIFGGLLEKGSNFSFFFYLAYGLMLLTFIFIISPIAIVLGSRSLIARDFNKLKGIAGLLLSLPFVIVPIITILLKIFSKTQNEI